MKDLLTWFITSSADPKKTSLAVIGALTFFSSYILQAIQIACAVGFVCLPIDGTILDTAINAIGTFVEGIMMAVGALLFVWGLARKLKFGRWTAAK